jgi:hypothetical protein
MCTSSLRVHVTIHSKEEDIDVDFDYDPTIDNVNSVARELNDHLRLICAEGEEAKRAITAKVAKQTGGGKGDDDSDEPIDDPGYRTLCERQAQGLRELDARHQAERCELFTNPAALSKQLFDDLLIVADTIGLLSDFCEREWEGANSAVSGLHDWTRCSDEQFMSSIHRNS